jgi:hypothetical protein
MVFAMLGVIAVPAVPRVNAASEAAIPG